MFVFVCFLLFVFFISRNPRIRDNPYFLTMIIIVFNNKKDRLTKHKSKTRNRTSVTYCLVICKVFSHTPVCDLCPTLNGIFTNVCTGKEFRSTWQLFLRGGAIGRAGKEKPPKDLKKGKN